MSMAPLPPTELVAKLAMIPDRYRDFTIDAEDASLEYGMQPADLERLLELGLPVRGSGAGRSFDRLDIANAALHLGVNCAQRRAVRGWRQTLLMVAAESSARWTLTYSGTAGTAFVTPERTIEVVQTAAGIRATVELDNRWAPLADQVAEELCSYTAGFQFLALPLELRENIGFAEHAGVAGCAMAARLLVRHCSSLGIRARARTGLLIALPFSTPHSWIELSVAGSWIPFDPHAIHMMIRHGDLDPRQWPPHRSSGVILAGFPDGNHPAAGAGAVAAPVMVVTEQATA